MESGIDHQRSLHLGQICLEFYNHIHSGVKEPAKLLEQTNDKIDLAMFFRGPIISILIGYIIAITVILCEIYYSFISFLFSVNICLNHKGNNQ